MVWCDGTFSDEQDFRVSPFDRSLCHGLSLFETILAVQGRPRMLRAHLDRLRLGLERYGITSVELSDSGLEAAMVSLLEKNGLTAGMARIRLAVGFGAGPINLIDSGEAWAWMTAVRVEESPKTLRMTSAPWRQNRESVTRGLKVGNYAEHLIAMDMARREGFDEMLFYNTSDELCETALANVFLIRGGALLTPSLDSGCLDGVTRRLVIGIAAERGIPCREKPLGQADVRKAEGIFLTSSVRGPAWVSEFEGRSYEVHPLFTAIQEIWIETMSKASP